MAAKKKAARKKSGRRELIDTGTNKLFVRRNARGTSFKKVVDSERSIARDMRTKPSARSGRDRATAATELKSGKPGLGNCA